MRHALPERSLGVALGGLLSAAYFILLGAILCGANAIASGRSVHLSKDDLSPLYGAYQGFTAFHLSTLRVTKAALLLDRQCRWTYTILNVTTDHFGYVLDVKTSPVHLAKQCPWYGLYQYWQVPFAPVPNIGRPALSIVECPTQRYLERAEKDPAMNVVCGSSGWEPVLLKQHPELVHQPKLDPTQRKAISLMVGRWQILTGPDWPEIRIERGRIIFSRRDRERYRVLDVRLDSKQSLYIVELKLFPVVLKGFIYGDQVRPYVAIAIDSRDVEYGKRGRVRWTKCTSIADALLSATSSTTPADTYLSRRPCQFDEYMEPVTP
jgi:hypothetical protein